MKSCSTVEEKDLFSRGFVTIATGNEKYYDLAHNLLESYRLNGKSSVPFAIICDRDCKIARDFDELVLISDPQYSYLDKLSVYQYTPYDETIFIDADILVMSDIDSIWDDFASCDDFSCYGSILPLESRDGWFYYKDMGDLQDQIEFGITMHGGLYYLRKTERCKEIFTKAIELTRSYDKYKFYYFTKPADEPVLALSMVLNGCKPCGLNNPIVVLPGNEDKIAVSRDGSLLFDGCVSEARFIHFGNRNRSRFVYQYYLKSLKMKRSGNFKPISGLRRFIIRLRCLPAELMHKIRRLYRKGFVAKGV